MAGEAADGRGREHVGVDYAAAKIGHEANGGGGEAVVPAQLGELVVVLIERFPAHEMGKGGDSDHIVGEFAVLGRVSEIIGGANHACADVAQLFGRLAPVKLFGVV